MKKILYIATLALLPLLTSCNDFLDITPKDKQTAQQLYATKSGFYTAANGIYDGLSSDDLYGKQMSWEALDVMSKRYSTTKNATYYVDLAQDNYTSTYVSPILTSVWQKAYELILASNILIDEVDKQHNILTPQEASLMKGEMYAVRAYLHLDMLRLFGPDPNGDHTLPGVPYNESATVTTLPRLTFEQDIDKIIADLDKAEELLQNDPVIEKGPMASDVEGESVQLRYRQFRFNYYAVIALKARAYIWAGDKANALKEAKRVLEDQNVQKWFPAVDPNKLLANTTNPDRVFSSEVLFGIYDKDRDKVYTENFSPEASESRRLAPYSTYVNGGRASMFSHLLFGPETQDYRFQSQWEQASTTGMTSYVFTKYKPISRPDENDENSEYFYSRMIPLLKLPELYLIATECEPEKTEGLKWYNAERTRRGCTEFPEAYADYIDSYFGGWPMLLSQEYMREFWGEGQIFFWLKRAIIAPGYPSGTVSPYDNGAEMGTAQLNIQPPLPAGEMK